MVINGKDRIFWPFRYSAVVNQTLLFKTETKLSFGWLL